MVPDISTATDIIFCYFRPCFALLPTPLSPPPTNNPKNHNFEKMKKTPGDIIILHKCTINDNHMIYGSWDIECNEHSFLSFWSAFCPFTPRTTQKNQNFVKLKKIPGNIIILHKCAINDNNMMYDS